MKQETQAFLQKVFDAYKTKIVVFKGDCHDCQKEVDVEAEMELDGKVEIRGGAIYPTSKLNGDLEIFFKCQDCFDKHPRLTDYQETQVWSRVVGFLRPVTDYNLGKKAEFKDRKMFDIGEFLDASVEKFDGAETNEMEAD